MRSGCARLGGGRKRGECGREFCYLLFASGGEFSLPLSLDSEGFLTGNSERFPKFGGEI